MWRLIFFAFLLAHRFWWTLLVSSIVVLSVLGLWLLFKRRVGLNFWLETDGPDLNKSLTVSNTKPTEAKRKDRSSSGSLFS